MQVAAAHSLALGFFPHWIAQLRNEGLNIATRLVATNVGDAVHALREGGCDLMLAFYDPDSAMQMDPEIFPSLHLGQRSEEHTSELQSLMRISYAVFCLQKKNTTIISIN